MYKTTEPVSIVLLFRLIEVDPGPRFCRGNPKQNRPDRNQHDETEQERAKDSDKSAAKNRRDRLGFGLRIDKAMAYRLVSQPNASPRGSGRASERENRKQATK